MGRPAPGLLELLAGEQLVGEVDAGTTDGGRVGHGRADEARIVSGVKELIDEGADVGVRDRHEVLFAPLIASTIRVAMPDAQMPSILSYSPLAMSRHW